MELKKVPVGRGEDDKMLSLVVRLIILLGWHVGKHDEGLADVIVLLDLQKMGGSSKRNFAFQWFPLKLYQNRTSWMEKYSH